VAGPFRSNASRNGPFGLCQAESFGNSFADSVSFRFPSWQSLDGHPVPPANYASGHATPAVSLQLIKNRKATGRLQACRLNASPRSVSCSRSYCPRNLAAALHNRQWSVSLFFSLMPRLDARDTSITGNSALSHRVGLEGEVRCHRSHLWSPQAFHHLQ